uniref:hypothetical protein n=1 Tax=Sphingomonas bacterium TaxID=1895847 RepID=UPI002601D5DA|nr:hypothetical protein [Sphingomonas bacterium]
MSRPLADGSPAYLPTLGGQRFASYDDTLGVGTAPTLTRRYGDMPGAAPAPPRAAAQPAAAPEPQPKPPGETPKPAAPPAANVPARGAPDKKADKGKSKAKSDDKDSKKKKAAGGASGPDGKEAGGGKPGAKGGRSGGRGARGDAETPAKKEAPAEQAVLSPVTGGHRLDRPAFRVRAPTGSFTAARELDVRPVAAAGAGPTTAKPAGPMLDYRSLYGSAVDESYGLYRRMMQEAEHIIGAADRRDRDLAALHQGQLDASLRSLDQALAESRAALVTDSEQLHLRLDDAADLMRRRIRSAASAAIGKLEARLGLFTGKLNPLREQRDGILATAKSGPEELQTAGNAAIKSLDAFVHNADGSVPQKYGVMNSVVREAQVTYSPGYAQVDKKMIETRNKEFNKYLTESFACLPCDFERAFQSLEGQASAMRDKGPKAVFAAQDGALKSVDAAVVSLGDAIDANREATDRILISQHQHTRESLIDTAQANAQHEGEAMAETAERQSESLANMAAGQPRAVEQVHDLIETQAIGPPAQFAQAVARATARLKSNLAGIGAKQPRATVEAAARVGANQVSSARQFEARQQAIVHGVGLSLGQVVDQAVAQVDKQIADAITGMDHVPADVRKSCDSHLAPAGPALDKAAQDLADAVGAVGARVHQILNGGDAMARQDAAVKERKAKTPAAPKAAETPKGKDKGKPKEAAEPAPEPASCGACKGSGEKADPKNDAGKDPLPKPDGAKSDGGGAKNDAKGPAEGDESTPNGFKALCEKIKTDPTAAPQVSGFLKRAEKTVPADLIARTGEINAALSTTFAPDIGGLMRNLRGLTALQGQAICFQYWKLHPSQSLEDKITEKFDKQSVLSMGSTDHANRDAALNALHGHATEGAMGELIAAFNYSNEDQRIRDVLLNLTPKQLEELNKQHGKELDDLATQLDGDDRKIFDELRAGKTALAKAHGLLEGVDSINRSEVDDKRGDAVAQKFTDASTDFKDALDGDKEAKQADIFHFEAPTEAVKTRNAQHWAEQQAAFAQLEPVKAVVGKGLDPKEAMLAYATRKIAHRPTGIHEKNDRRTITYDTVNEYHKEWIRQILEKGADSVEAKGARVLVEERRAKPDLKGLDSATHSGAGDAREGGGYDAKERAAGKEEAKAERTKIFEASEKARAKIEHTEPTDVKTAQERLKKSFSRKLSDDEAGQRVAAGMIESDAGDPAAIMDYAIKHEKKDLALMQLKRMDRREIAEFVKDYNKDGKNLFKKLGVFEHFGKSGTVFDGDDANELTIAFMGVPQNDKERGEVALKVMTQTIDQSGALGRGLAGEEYQALLDNARRLKEEMGVTDAAIDSHGYIRGTDRDGNPIVTKFDEKGNLVPGKGGNITAFESAVAMARVTSTSYTQATDRIASFITTALMVIAAVLTTILTGGAAASIWIPVLVTAGAGLVGMALTASIKGGRYTRDEMVRDLAMTIVQAATAGIGAAVGAGLRGGAGAVRTLATTMRVSEQALAEAASKTVMLRGLTLVEEMAIGAGSSALSGGVGAAVDPAARHGDDYGMGIFHGILRGALGGAVGAGVTRGVTSGLGSLARGVGARSGASMVLARGGSLELAARVAQMRSKALSTSFLTEVGTRALASGLSGAATRVTDIGYNRVALNQKMTAGQMFEEIGWAFVQNAVQGFAEGTADRGMRSMSATRADEHAFTTLEQHHEFREAAMEAVIEQGRKRGLLPPAEAAPRPAPQLEGAPAARLPAGTEEEAPRRIAAVDEKGAILPAPHHEEEAARLARMVDPEGEGPLVARTADEDAAPGKIKIAANDNPGAPVHVRVSLADTEMVSAAHLPADSILVHPDSHSRVAANDNFGRMINADPSREVAVYRNPVTGEFIVVVGAERSVASIRLGGELERGNGKGTLPVSRDGVPEPGGHWVLSHHYHPNRKGEAGTRLLRRLPSGVDGDFAVIYREAISHGYDEHSSRIYFVDNGKVSHTDFGFDANNPKARFWVEYPNPLTGTRTREEFATIGEYHTFLNGVQGDPAKAAAGGSGRARTADNDNEAPVPPSGADPARRVGGEQAAIDDRLTPHNMADAAFAGARMERVADFEAQLSGHKQIGDIEPTLGRAAALNDAMESVKRMGLVDRPDATIRLTALLNDPSVPDKIKPLIARAALEATREAMLRDGRLSHGDELLMLFRGASSERLEDYKRTGIDPTLATNREEDVGPGLYMSQDLESAKRYGGADSTVLPFIVRRSELGNVFDISPGSPLRARWEDFVMQNWSQFGFHPTTAGARGKQGPADFNQFGALWFERANRVILFDAFRESIAADKTLSPSTRQAASDPDIVLTDLGGPMTWGNDRGFVTDQAAMKTRHVADLMNDQLGFPRAGTPTEDDMLRGTGPARTADGGGDGEPPAARPRTRKPRVKPVADETEAPAIAAPATPKRGGRSKKAVAIPDEEAAGGTAKPAVEPGEAEAPVAKTPKQSKRELDPVEGARRNRELAEAREDAVRLMDEAREAKRLRSQEDPLKAKAMAERPDKPAEVDKVVAAIRPLETLEDRIGALAEHLANPDIEISPEARRYLDWLAGLWHLQAKLEWAKEMTLAGGKPVFKRDQDAKEGEVIAVRFAQDEARRANLGLKEHMRKVGPNYKDIKKKATYDKIMGEAAFERLQQAAQARVPPETLGLNPDHLVSLDEIANMPELSPIFDLYAKASSGMREDMKRDLTDLGDIKDNLLAMWDQPNQGMKSNKSWHDISFERAADFQYSAPDVIRMRIAEDKMRAEIKIQIARLIAKYRKKLAQAGRLPIDQIPAPEFGEDEP